MGPKTGVEGLVQSAEAGMALVFLSGINASTDLSRLSEGAYIGSLGTIAWRYHDLNHNATTALSLH